MRFKQIEAVWCDYGEDDCRTGLLILALGEDGKMYKYLEDVIVDGCHERAWQRMTDKILASS